MCLLKSQKKYNLSTQCMKNLSTMEQKAEIAEPSHFIDEETEAEILEISRSSWSLRHHYPNTNHVFSVS